MAQRRHLSDDALLVRIKAIHAETRGGYGWPRTWKELLARGIRVGKERVQKLMQLHGIRAKGKRRFKVTTDSNHDLPIAPNLLGRQFTVDQGLDESARWDCWADLGSCHNACSETLFGSLKVERLCGQKFETRRQAKNEVIDWLLRYNRTRLHSTLVYPSPMKFEQDWLANQPGQGIS